MRVRAVLVAYVGDAVHAARTVSIRADAAGRAVRAGAAPVDRAGQYQSTAMKMLTMVSRPTRPNWAFSTFSSSCFV